MEISTITLNVALAIGAGTVNKIEQFSKEADCNEYTLFTHYNFFYSYPEWEKKWKDGKLSEFHRVHTKCHLCDYRPERNYAGIGSIYILNNGLCNKTILVKNGTEIRRGKECTIFKEIPNTPQLSQMILLCPDHIGSYFDWRLQTKTESKVLQLQLF